MQQQLRKAPPPPQALAIVILAMGLFALVVAGRIVWGWLSSADPEDVGRKRLEAAVAAFADQKPNRAARLAGEAAALLQQGKNRSLTLQAHAVQARALHAAGRAGEARRALEQALALEKQAGPDPYASETLAELFFSLQRYPLTVEAALHAARGFSATGGETRAARLLAGFAGRLAVVGASREAVRLYAEAITLFMGLNMVFEAAQLYERIGITLAPLSPVDAYPAYIEAMNRFISIGETRRAEAVGKRIQQLPQSFLETIIE